MGSQGYRVPRWVAVIVWPVQLVFVYVVTPSALSETGKRHGWRRGRPGPVNRLGLLLLVPGLLGLAWTANRHLAESPRTIEVPRPAPDDLITGGVYRWSRNPMYAAGIATWAGWSLYYGSVAVAAGAAVFSSAIAFLAVPYEERALQARFGATYEQYKETVSRWVGRPGPGAGASSASSNQGVNLTAPSKASSGRNRA